jgi:hypothetical protein
MMLMPHSPNRTWLAVRLRLGDAEQESEVEVGTVDPQWGAIFEFEGDLSAHVATGLHLEIYDVSARLLPRRMGISAARVPRSA